MKKYLLSFFVAVAMGTICLAQDTLITHKNGVPVAKLIVQSLDSLRFFKGGANSDTMRIYAKAGYNDYYLLSTIDSITFKKADTADYATPAGYELLTASAYSPLKFWYGKEEGMGISEMGTDLWTTGSETNLSTAGLAAENKPFITYQYLNESNLNVTRL